jgi:glycerol-3-phosphate acyltransferase PlsX
MMVTIAVDAMGGDNAPDVVVSGVIKAAQKGVSICLFGQEQRLVSLLSSFDLEWKTKYAITIVHCPDVIGMEEISVRHIFKQKMSSVYIAIDHLKQKKVAAVVSAGNSTAIHAMATCIIERVAGVLRPALGTFLPTVYGGRVYCLDLGANTDCKPIYLEQFAYMADIYVRELTGILRPRVGLLSNGHEPYKGSSVVKDVFKRLKNSSLNFVGNIEARDIFQGHTDIIVCDGFVGNIMLKTAQGTVKAVTQIIAQEAKASYLSRFLLGITGGLFKKIKSRFDYANVGGALLLGVKEPVVIAHGSSTSEAIENAILFAHEVVLCQYIKKFNQTVQATMQKVSIALDASNSIHAQSQDHPL